MSEPRVNLGGRASFVFARLLGGRGRSLHPADRREAEDFWEWLGGFEEPALIEQPRRRRPLWASAAAVAALIVLLLASTLVLQRSSERIDGVTYAAGHGERRSIRLSDGSMIRLGAESRVTVDYARGERRIRLAAGEALFDVASDARRPFVVEVEHGEVIAVGTAFDVRLAPGGARVTVVEGIVRVALPGGGRAPITRTARAGEQIRFGAAREAAAEIGFISEASSVDPAKVTAWTRGVLHFRGEPLEEVLSVVNRYASERISLADPSLARIPVYGVLHEGDTAALVDLIEDPDGLRVDASDR